MTGLVLKLSPKERLLVNGAVLENGERRSRITVVTPNARILRLKDAIHPDEANTPVKRACFLAQLLLSGDLDSQSAAPQLDLQLAKLAEVFRGEACSMHLASAHGHFESQNFYQCLKSLRQLLPIEDRLLSN